VPSAQTAVGVVPLANACRNMAFPVPSLKADSAMSSLSKSFSLCYLYRLHFVNHPGYALLQTSM
jgi:hypothetical protein